MHRQIYTRLSEIAKLDKEAGLQDDIKHTWQGIKSWFSPEPEKSDTSRITPIVVGNFIKPGSDSTNIAPMDRLSALPDLNAHLTKYDADPDTPGFQSVNYKTGVDNTEKLLRDPDTLRLGYLGYHALGADGISSYKTGVEDDAAKAYEQYLNSFGDATRKNAQNRDIWTREWIQKNNPTYYAIDGLAALGKGVDYNNGKYTAKGDWANRAANMYGQLKPYRNSDGTLNTSKLYTDLVQDTDRARQLDSAMLDAHKLFSDSNTSGIVGTFGTRFGNKIPKALSAYSAIGGRDGVKSLNYIQQANNDNSLLFTPEGRKHLDSVNQLLGSPQIMGQLKDLSPDVHEQLVSNAGKLNWLGNNYNAASNLYEFKQSPIMFILKNLFSGNPGRLYSVINSMGKMYDPKTVADADWNKYLVGNNKQLQNYAQYLPWMQMLGNVRSSLGGDGVSFG